MVLYFTLRWGPKSSSAEPEFRSEVLHHFFAPWQRRVCLANCDLVSCETDFPHHKSPFEGAAVDVPGCLLPAACRRRMLEHLKKSSTERNLSCFRLRETCCFPFWGLISELTAWYASLSPSCRHVAVSFYAAQRVSLSVSLPLDAPSNHQSIILNTLSNPKPLCRPWTLHALHTKTTPPLSRTPPARERAPKWSVRKRTMTHVPQVQSHARRFCCGVIFNHQVSLRVRGVDWGRGMATDYLNR